MLCLLLWLWLVFGILCRGKLDAGGEFVTVEQPGLADAGKIRIDPTEWTALRAAIDRMIGECRALQAAI